MSKNNENNWLYFSQSYLQIAKISCCELINSKHNKQNENKGFWTYHIEDLIIPIIYNIKHGIEVFIKTISFIIDKQHDNGHDIYGLFKKLKKKIQKLDLKPCSINGDIITQKMIDDFPNDIEKIEKIIKYFYEVEFLKNKIKGNLSVYDTQNDIFRYPENKATAQIKINWEEVLSSFDINEVKKIKMKIEELYVLFNNIGYFITILLKSNKDSGAKFTRYEETASDIA